MSDEIIITVSGGVVQDVSMPEACPYPVIIRDYDADSIEVERLTKDEDGELFLESVHEPELKRYLDSYWTIPHAKELIWKEIGEIIEDELVLVALYYAEDKYRKGHGGNDCRAILEAYKEITPCSN